MRPGKVVCLTEATSPELDVTAGNDQLRQFVTSEMTRDIVSILQYAGYGGKFTLCVQRRARGTRHTRGLRIRFPADRGVHITGHYLKGNDTRVECLLCSPNGEDSSEFRQSLIEGYRKWCDTTEETRGVSPTSAKDDSCLDETGVVGSEAGTTTVDSLEPSETVKSSGSNSGFSFDQETIELCMMLFSERCRSDGQISRKECIDIICQESGISWRASAGKVLNAWIRRGYLVKASAKEGDDLLQIAYQLPTDEQELSVDQDSPSEETPVGQGASGVALRLQQLESMVAQLPALEEELRKVEEQLSEARRQLEVGENRKAEILKKKGVVEDAAGKLVTIKALLE